jgi:hypothetical protein
MRQPLTTAKRLPLRAACQEDVAKMLGFDHWHHAIDAIRKNTSAVAKTEKPEFWVYLMRLLNSMPKKPGISWPGASSKTCKVSLGLSGGNHLQVTHNR